ATTLLVGPATDLSIVGLTKSPPWGLCSVDAAAGAIRARVRLSLPPPPPPPPPSSLRRTSFDNAATLDCRTLRWVPDLDARALSWAALSVLGEERYRVEVELLNMAQIAPQAYRRLRIKLREGL
ncbi:hypothetical protein Vafri_7489, partial [Volvox africanus]